MKTLLSVKYLVILLILLGLIALGIYIFLNSSPKTLPKIPPTSTPGTNNTTSDLQQKISGMSLRDKILSLMILHTPGTDAKEIASFISKYHPAGVILMDDNISNNNDQIRELTSAIQEVSSPYPSLIAIDEEGCTVKRIPSDNFLCSEQLKSLSPKETYSAFQKRSIMLHDLGINLNFGIVADITGNESSFIFPRVFGADPKKVSDHIVAALQGSHPYVLSTLKHFPGHGRTSSNSHITIPDVLVSEDDWRSFDYLPFKAGIEANTEFIMFGHLNYKNVDDSPATLSSKWHSLLEKEAGFKNITITDDMIMLQKSQDPQYEDVVKNAIQAINAGNHILLYVNDYNLVEEPVRQIDIDQLVSDIEAAVNSGEVDQIKLNISAEKVLEMRAKLPL
ncbi:MAG: glycoside hydrolase family 3 N-terminal domain-containing protein [Candidatus Daviesbacteria bacterium]|nr:glycoside hydrolase family 3 N-terminal domain-containing protein [Candidatus Daviesbacteria bacterium]